MDSMEEDEYIEDTFEVYADDVEYTRPLWQRVLMGVIALISVTMLLWTYQVRPYFLYRETPAVVIEPLAPKDSISVAPITVPLRILIARGGENAGSLRDSENIELLTENAEAIWHQAGIVFDVVDVQTILLSDAAALLMLNDPVTFWGELREQGDESVLVLLTRTLRGSNGISWAGLRAFAVADVTSVPDYRAYAHELGHVLGLSHVDESLNRLLYQGANGSELTQDEITTARAVALRIWPTASAR